MKKNKYKQEVDKFQKAVNETLQDIVIKKIIQEEIQEYEHRQRWSVKYPNLYISISVLFIIITLTNFLLFISTILNVKNENAIEQLQQIRILGGMFVISAMITIPLLYNAIKEK